MSLSLALACLILLAHRNHAAKILVYNPDIGASHPLLIGKIADELAYGGHNVTILQQVMVPGTKSPGHTHPAIEFIQRPRNESVLFERFQTSFWTEDRFNLFNNVKHFRSYGNVLLQHCQAQLADRALLRRLRAAHFQLGVAENVDPCGLLLFRRLGVRRFVLVTGTSPVFLTTAHFGLPTPLSYVPDLFDAAPEGFVGRLVAALRHHFFVSVIGNVAMRPLRQLLAENGVPADIQGHAAFIWANTDEFVDFPRPISHKYINIGGYGMRRAMEQKDKMEPELEKVLEEADQVVLVSFGSAAPCSTMPAGLRRAFVAAFASLPRVRFVWKFENASADVAAPNLHTAAWLPQRRILAHPRTVAFVTHAGMNSVTEATYAGVPMLTIPLFSDQRRNADMVVRKGVSITLQKTNLTEETIKAALSELITNPSYRDRARTLSQIIRAKPQSPEERLVQSAEFAANFDLHEHLDLRGRQLGLLAYYNIDVYACLGLAALTTLCLLLWTVWWAIRRLLSWGWKAKVE